MSASLTDHCTHTHRSASKLLINLDKEGTPAPLGTVMTERRYSNGHFGHGGDEPSGSILNLYWTSIKGGRKDKN